MRIPLFIITSRHRLADLEMKVLTSALLFAHPCPTELRITPDTELGDNTTIRTPPKLPTTPFPNRERRRRRQQQQQEQTPSE